MKDTAFRSEVELLSGIYTEVKEINKKLPDSSREIIADLGVMNNTELCRALNISKKTAARWRRGKVLRYSRVGGIFYYKRSDIKEMLQKGFDRS